MIQEQRTFHILKICHMYRKKCRSKKAPSSWWNMSFSEIVSMVVFIWHCSIQRTMSGNVETFGSKASFLPMISMTPSALQLFLIFSWIRSIGTAGKKCGVMISAKLPDKNSSKTDVGRTPCSSYEQNTNMHSCNHS